MDLNISLDLGSDTLKVAYAFSYLGKDFYGKITPESYDGFTANPFPAVAFYHDVDKRWFFADEVDSIRSNSYFNTVKIKSLLTLLSDFNDSKTNKINRDFYNNRQTISELYEDNGLSKQQISWPRAIGIPWG